MRRVHSEKGWCPVCGKDEKLCRCGSMTKDDILKASHRMDAAFERSEHRRELDVEKQYGHHLLPDERMCMWFHGRLRRYAK